MGRKGKNKNRTTAAAKKKSSEEEVTNVNNVHEAPQSAATADSGMPDDAPGAQSSACADSAKSGPGLDADTGGADVDEAHATADDDGAATGTDNANLGAVGAIPESDCKLAGTDHERATPPECCGDAEASRHSSPMQELSDASGKEVAEEGNIMNEAAQTSNEEPQSAVLEDPEPAEAFKEDTSATEAALAEHSTPAVVPHAIEASNEQTPEAPEVEAPVADAEPDEDSKLTVEQEPAEASTEEATPAGMPIAEAKTTTELGTEMPASLEPDDMTSGTCVESAIDAGADKILIESEAEQVVNRALAEFDDTADPGFVDDCESDDEQDRPSHPTLLHEIAERARLAATVAKEQDDSVASPWVREQQTEASHASEPPNLPSNFIGGNSTRSALVDSEHTEVEKPKKVETDAFEADSHNAKRLEGTIGRGIAPPRISPVEEWLPADPDPDPDLIATDPFLNEDEIDAKYNISSELARTGMLRPTSNIVGILSQPHSQPSHEISKTTIEKVEERPVSVKKAQDDDETIDTSSNEQLETLLRARQGELQQMRSDFDARVRRSAELRNALKAQGGSRGETPATLRAAISEARNHLQAIQLSAERSVMCGEDLLGASRKLLQARDSEIRFLERKMHEMQQKHQRLVHSREPVSDQVAQEALTAKKKQHDALLSDTEAQEKKIGSLFGDLKSVIDFMMRVNIEALGGPAPNLTAEDFLPEDVRKHMNVSKYTQVLIKDLIRKYELCMEQSQEKSTASTTNPSISDGQGTMRQQPRAVSQVDDQDTKKVTTSPLSTLDDVAKPFTPPPLPLGEALTESFSQETKLLRERFADEMRKVASALADEDVPVGTNPSRETLVVHEILRAAAWGDETTLRELLPLSGRSLEAWHKRGDDPALLGWTPWHASAAHGQAATLDVLREFTSLQGGNHPKAQGQLTASGLPPLAVACLRGHVEVARSLLAGKAPLHVCDARGNSPVHWAAASGMAKAAPNIHQMLIQARCDPDARNSSGQCAYQNNGMPSTASGTGTVAHNPDRRMPQSEATPASAPPPVEDPNLSIEPGEEPYHIIEAVGWQQDNQQGGFFQSALNMLKVPVRDAVGFARNDRVKALANLNPYEAENGVWSEWVVNYTHAGLKEALLMARSSASPILEERNRQAIVLTSERLLFFNVATWSLILTIPMSELIDIRISSHSKSVLLIRSYRRCDVLIDMAARDRFLDELQVMTRQYAVRFAGAAFGDDAVVVRSTADAIATLQDEQQQLIGTIAYVEPNVFLFLPFAPSSILLTGQVPTFFGFLDVQRSARTGLGTGVQWRWHYQFFVLKVGPGEQRMLLWCNHPTDTEVAGRLSIDHVRNIQAINSVQGEPCIVIEHASETDPSSSRSLTLRARTPDNRDDWVSCLNALVSGRMFLG